ncbi:MAG: hypothetical protein MHM6MM_002552 [Cercozoa sp. M6MM]
MQWEEFFHLVARRHHENQALRREGKEFNDTLINVPFGAPNTVSEAVKKIYGDVSRGWILSWQIPPLPFDDTVDSADAWHEQEQFLFKIQGKSYWDVEWLDEESMKERFGFMSVRSRVRRFRAKLNILREKYFHDFDGNPFDPQFFRVDRIFAQRAVTREKGKEKENNDDKEKFKGLESMPKMEDEEEDEEEEEKEYLVRWRGLSYSQATWEHVSRLTQRPEIIQKITEYERFQIVPSDLLHRNLEKSELPESRRLRYYDKSPIYKNGNKLRSYQLDGVNWLIRLVLSKRNGILADEMGLGKTVQSTALLQHLYAECNVRGPFLVVVPLSTLSHWKRTLETWTDMNVVVYHDPHKGAESRELIRRYEFYFPFEKEEEEERIPKFHVLLTTYETVVQDVQYLSAFTFEELIVDEGHRLKSRTSKLCEALTKMDIKRRLLLTGTPVQNSLEELWSLLLFLHDEQFADEREFAAKYENDAAAQAKALFERIRPFMLRRLKTTVEALPPKKETILPVEMTTKQKMYYRAVYERNRNFLVATNGNTEVIPKLMLVEMELRKVCNHPFLIEGVMEKETGDAAFMKAVAKDPSKTAESFFVERMLACSGKMILLDKLLQRLRGEGHRVLIFSQMKRVLNLIEDILRWRCMSYERIDGSTRSHDRAAALERFTDPTLDANGQPRRFAFLLTTRAGGVGLNLTAADTVIMFDADWNPQQDIQACARCHRIGQTRPVTVYRLVTRNSYEQQMFIRASQKLSLDRNVLNRITGDTSDKKARGIVPEEDRSALDSMLRLGTLALQDTGKSKEDADEDEDESDKYDIDRIMAESTTVTTHELGSAVSQLHSNESELDVGDDDFWRKALDVVGDGGDDSLRALATGPNARDLLRRLTSNEVQSLAEQQQFMSTLEPLVESCLKAEEDETNKGPSQLDDLMAIVVQITTVAQFPRSMRSVARTWLPRLKEAAKRRRERQHLLALSMRQQHKKRRRATAVYTSKRRDDDYSEKDMMDDADDEFSLQDADVKRRGARRIWKGERVCSECAAGGALLECDGPCLGAYHRSCAESPLFGAAVFDAEVDAELKALKVVNHPRHDDELLAEIMQRRRRRQGDDLLDETALRDSVLKLSRLDRKNMLRGVQKPRWLCGKCKQGATVCQLCHGGGVMCDTKPPDGSVLVRCAVAGCGRWYHWRCVAAHAATVPMDGGTLRFRCPAHKCAVCQWPECASARNSGDLEGAQEDTSVLSKRKKKAMQSMQLLQCARCCISFHTQCAPRDVTRLSHRYLLCRDCVAWSTVLHHESDVSDVALWGHDNVQFPSPAFGAREGLARVRRTGQSRTGGIVSVLCALVYRQVMCGICLCVSSRWRSCRL